jgi:hypothetical protein
MWRSRLMNMFNIDSPANQASFSAWAQRMKDRATNACELTRDGTHTWQYSHRAVLGDGFVYECNCGATEVRK